MLDVTVRAEDGSLSFEVYRKPTHTNLYIPINSHQPIQHKLSTIIALTCRVYLIFSTPQARATELRTIREALAINGYTEWAFQEEKYCPPASQPDPPEDSQGATHED